MFFLCFYWKNFKNSTCQNLVTIYRQLSDMISLITLNRHIENSVDPEQLAS